VRSSFSPATRVGVFSFASFLVGERYSIADISLYAYTHVANEGDFDLEPYARSVRGSSTLPPSRVTSRSMRERRQTRRV
jgi:glutathione S-transferase